MSYDCILLYFLYIYKVIDKLCNHAVNADKIKLINVIDIPSIVKLILSHGGLVFFNSCVVFCNSWRVGNTVLQLLGANHQ